MSLNWNFTNQEVFKALSKKEKQLNDLYIFGCMVTGIPDITEKVAEEWQWRYAFAVQLNGAFYYNHDKTPLIPTVEDVKKRIGLETNCSSKTRKQFQDSQIKIYENSEYRRKDSPDEKS